MIFMLSIVVVTSATMIMVVVLSTVGALAVATVRIIVRLLAMLKLCILQTFASITFVFRSFRLCTSQAWARCLFLLFNYGDTKTMRPLWPKKRFPAAADSAFGRPDALGCEGTAGRDEVGREEGASRSGGIAHGGKSSARHGEGSHGVFMPRRRRPLGLATSTTTGAVLATSTTSGTSRPLWLASPAEDGLGHPQHCTAAGTDGFGPPQPGIKVTDKEFEALIDEDQARITQAVKEAEEELGGALLQELHDGSQAYWDTLAGHELDHEEQQLQDEA